MGSSLTRIMDEEREYRETIIRQYKKSKKKEKKKEFDPWEPKNASKR